jgi:TorA maturation chaperone TorD/Pyruvate/2-oxoacid:ferredoxin oxidoreductase delta subunit
MDAKTARERSRTYSELARAFLGAASGLEQEFTRLFLGPGRPVAHPYESVYREGRTMGETTLEVRRLLAEEGLAPQDRILPDHVSIELAFMARLAACEARAWDDGHDDEARDLWAQQDSFLHDHLITWLPQFCHRVLAGRPLDPYAELARYAETFVTRDAARVRAWLANGAEEATGAIALQEGWAVTVGSACTLCDICVQVCRPGALQQVRQAERETVVLYFDAALCDGCAACQRWCPEETINVRRMEAGEHPSSGELAHSDMSACPRCGQPYAPEAMIAKVQAQVGIDDEALLQRLALCHNCKVTAVPLRRRSR